MNEKTDVTPKDLIRDRQRLCEVKEKESKLKEKLVRVEILNGYVMTTNRDNWMDHEIKEDRGKRKASKVNRKSCE